MFTKKLAQLTLVILVTIIGANFAALPQDSDADYILAADATLDEIIDALRTAPENYETLHIHITEYDHLYDNVMIDKVWLSRVEGTYRWETTNTSSNGEVFESLNVSDGEYIYTTLNGQSIVTLNPLEPSAVVSGLGVVTTTIAPEAVANTLANSDGRDGEIASDIQIEIIGVETVQSRETIRIAYASEWRMMNLWVDMEKGILLQHELWTPDGQLVRTVTTNFVEFNPVFDDPETLFYVDQSAYDPEALDSLFSEMLEEASMPPTGG